MTNKEATKIVKNFPNQGYLNNKSITVSFDILNIQFEKKGLLDIFQHASREYRGWNNFQEDLPGHLSISKRIWTDLYNKLTVLINSLTNTTDENIDTNAIEREWTKIKKGFSDLNRRKVLPYNHPYASFLLSVFKDYNENYNGAERFLLYPHERIEHTKPDDFIGVMLAYEFKFSDVSKLTTRKRAERSSINRLRSDFEKFYTSIQVQTNNYNKNLLDQIKVKSKEFETIKNSKVEEFNDWFSKSQDKIVGFNESSSSKIQKLEQLYTEKLMLEKPAEYWRERAEKLNEEGKKWVYWLVGCAAFAIILLFVVLVLINNNTLEKVFSNTGSGIRWSIVFVTFISFLAYGIRTFAKLTFSTFHLVRDAEERRQLVYVYLSLKEEKNLQPEERQLILQSIFSRADSGLLREDSSPTMPGAGSVFDKITGK